MKKLLEEKTIEIGVENTEEKKRNKLMQMRDIFVEKSGEKKKIIKGRKEIISDIFFNYTISCYERK